MTTLILKSPTQASDIYSQNNKFPKSKQAFLARFTTNGSSKAPLATTMTYVVKQVDRPSVVPHAEELNQYGKKRIVYTGYKLSTLKVTLYDTADNAVQSMWANYQKYYFGDFGQSSPAMFSGNDIYGNTFNDGAGNYGLILQAASNSQFYFTTIELLHFYSGTYDHYTLINPKIVNYTLDDLDYSGSDISTISIEFMYEALLFSPAGSSNVASSAIEFQGEFNGSAFDSPAGSSSSAFSAFNSLIPNTTNSDSSSILNNMFGFDSYSDSTIANPISDYRYYTSQNGGGLGSFGNFSFGPLSSVINGINYGANIANNLASVALGNPALAATLNLSYSSNPLASGASPFSIPSSVPVVYTSSAAGVSQNLNNTYGNVLGTIATGVAGAALLGSANGLISGATGVSLSPTALGLINSQFSGSTQYGYNNNAGYPSYSQPVSGNAGLTTNPFDTSAVTVSYPQTPNTPITVTGSGNVTDAQVQQAALNAANNLPEAPGTTITTLPSTNLSNNDTSVNTLDSSTGVEVDADYSLGY